MAPPTQRHRGICPHLEHSFVTQFPQYGFKRPLLPESASTSLSASVTGFRIGSVARRVKGTRLFPSHGRVGSDIRRVRRVTRVPRLSGLAVTFGLSWDVHGSWPPPRLCCPRPPRYYDPICPAPSHPSTSRVALIRGALPFTGVPGGGAESFLALLVLLFRSYRSPYPAGLLGCVHPFLTQRNCLRPSGPGSAH